MTAAAALPGLTVLAALLCSGLFLAAYVQLWLQLCYRLSRLSCQSSLLACVLLWAALRLTLLAFYLDSCAWSRELQPNPHWLLYCAPICLQFISLCLLNLYYYQVICKASCTPEYSRYRTSLHVGFFFIGLTFLIAYLSCIVIGNKTSDPHGWIAMSRVIITECLFAACSLALLKSCCKIGNTSSAHVYLESKGTSGTRAVISGSVIGVMYFLRALYNLTAVFIPSDSRPTPLSYGLKRVLGQAATGESNNVEYFIFMISVLLCEVLPMSFVSFFFCPRKQGQNLEAAGMVNSHSFGSRAYFFDNPRRYDSDEDLPRLASGRAERGSLSSTPKTSGWYGAICPPSGCALAPPLTDSSSEVPIVFTCGANA
ncbi:integral membrane protein GPR137C [Hyperolius riggenbachi]|uniref:integral membrane protein GPR137C n=1 Tax=Hyperolius riggenbachi TaxID=752182 RepID=UPI0035A2772B